MDPPHKNGQQKEHGGCGDSEEFSLLRAIAEFCVK